MQTLHGTLLRPRSASDCTILKDAIVRPGPWIAAPPADQQISVLLYTLGPSQIERVFIAGRRVGP